MKKRQLIATLACLLVGMAGFAGAYSMEQTDQSQAQQEAEISTTELSQVSGVIEPEPDGTEGNDSEVSVTSADASGNSDDSNTGGDIADSNTGGDADVASTGTDVSGTGAFGTDQAVASNEDSADADTTGADDAASTSADADNAGADDVASTSTDTDNTDADDAASASADTADTDSSADGEGEDDAETVDADAVQFAADLRWPLEAGSVVLDYSMDHMVYFETLEQYQYNPAMIISAEVGDKVYVVAEGMITDISTNEETGLTVTEDLGNGYTAIYGQLENVNFAVGDTVERGHVLGYVAETTKYYSVEGTNLYFAMELDGAPVNPLEYFAD